MVEIGIIGTGFIGETHVDCYRQMDGVEVTAVATRSGSEGFVSSRGLDASTFDDGEAVIEDADIDAIDICTPTPTHRDFVAAAMDRAVPTFCEKPLAGTLSEVLAIAEAVEGTDVPFMPGHVVRFFPAYARLQQSVTQGEIGAPGVARTRRLSPYPDWGTDDWYADEAASGGVIVDLAIHDIDFLRWVWGDVERVFARTAGGKRNRHAHLTLRFANGAVGAVEGSWCHPETDGLRTTVELAGDEGLLEYDSDDPVPLRATVDGQPVTSLEELHEGPYRRELEAFVECVRAGTAPSRVSLEDAVEAVRTCLAARESAAQGQPVVVEEVQA